MIQLIKNKYVQWIGILLIGITVGALFYPSKSITREETAKYEQIIDRVQEEKRVQVANAVRIHEKSTRQLKEYKKESEHKLSSLKTENTHLKQRVKETKIKIVKPDGTIMEKSYKESDTEVVSKVITSIKEEFNEKVTSIENKWKQVHERRVTIIKDSYEKKLNEKQSTIELLSKKEKIEINKKSFGISIGMTDDGNYTGGISYDIWGPLFLDAHLGYDVEEKDKQFGLGLGVRF